MSTYDERYDQAIQHATKMADAAYDMAFTLKDKASAYLATFTREMDAFKQLEAMRKPVPNQAEVDANAAATLKKVMVPVMRDAPLRAHGPDEKMYSKDGIHWYYPGEEPVFDLVEAPRCPQCDVPAPSGRCAHCEGE